MIIFIRIEVPPSVARPGVPIAQILRELTPIIEMAVPLNSGFYPDRLTGQTRAEWTCESNATLKDLEAIPAKT